jgi:hypothetical protein
LKEKKHLPPCHFERSELGLTTSGKMPRSEKSRVMQLKTDCKNSSHNNLSNLSQGGVMHPARSLSASFEMTKR